MKDRLSYFISKYGLIARKKFGQNFLIVPDIIERNVDRAELSGKDEVLEIGPGLGFLTDALSRNSGRVYAIERDSRLTEILRKEYSWPNVTILEGDATKIEWPPFTKMVSNLPYQISSAVTFKLLEHEFEKAVLMYQLEFAQRMVANPGDHNYSRLSLMIKAKANAEVVEKIGKGAFWPKPKVDSAVVILEPKPAEERLNLNENLVRALFQHRKSTVVGALKKSHHILGLSRDDLKVAIKAIEGTPYGRKRVFHLSPMDVLEIEEHLKRENFLKNLENHSGGNPKRDV